jgi:hypothetical protein
MRIIRATVGYAHGFNDKTEEYADHKPSLTLEAEIEPWEVAEVVVDDLFKQARDRVLAERKRIDDAALVGHVVEQLDSAMSRVRLHRLNVSEGDSSPGRLKREKERLADAERRVDELRGKLIALGAADRLPIDGAGAVPAQPALDDGIPF